MVLAIHFAYILGIAKKARDSCLEDRPDEIYRHYPECLTAIIFSSIALEAYINEVAAGARHRQEFLAGLSPKPGVTVQRWHGLERFSDRMNYMVRENWNLEEKYSEAVYLLSDKYLNRGSQPFQDFALLIKLRNWITHLRPTLKTSIEQDLGRRGMLRQALPVEDPNATAWIADLEKVQTPEVASWAVDTAVSVIKYMRSLAPPDMPNLLFEVPIEIL